MYTPCQFGWDKDDIPLPHSFPHPSYVYVLADEMYLNDAEMETKADQKLIKN